MDPYLEFRLDGKTIDSTPVLRNGGRNPIWRQQFDIMILESSKQLEACMMDEDVIKDDFIGLAKQLIESIPEEVDAIEVDLMNEEEKVGIVRFKIYCR
jgi:Ca2+-dependent lipid-binding protein